MGWKHISTLHQIPVTSKDRLGEFINGGKDSKNMYMEALLTGIDMAPYNSDN